MKYPLTFEDPIYNEITDSEVMLIRDAKGKPLFSITQSVKEYNVQAIRSLIKNANKMHSKKPDFYLIPQLGGQYIKSYSKEEADKVIKNFNHVWGDTLNIEIEPCVVVKLIK